MSIHPPECCLGKRSLLSPGQMLAGEVTSPVPHALPVSPHGDPVTPPSCLLPSPDPAPDWPGGVGAHSGIWPLLDGEVSLP